MQAVPGSGRMSVRFKLIAHYAGHRPQQVLSPKLSVWHRSHEGVARYVYKQTIKQLGPGASYRVLVRFRWYDSQGRVIRRAKRVSGACVQDGELPNLVVTKVRIARGTTAGNRVYRVTFANTGKGSAENFSVALILDGALADSRTIVRLDPGQEGTIELNGPPCHRLRAVVDRENAVHETNEDDNSLRSTC
jgi:hypothetical protein